MIVVDVETPSKRNNMSDVQVSVFEPFKQQKLLQMMSIDEGTLRS
jgi:hypothetical protein